VVASAFAQSQSFLIRRRPRSFVFNWLREYALQPISDSSRLHLSSLALDYPTKVVARTTIEIWWWRYRLEHGR